jgi:hypothetical protein
LKWLHKERVNYDRLSDLSGVLSNVSDEYYRKVMVPYEKQKEAENGSIEI